MALLDDLVARLAAAETAIVDLSARVNTLEDKAANARAFAVQHLRDHTRAGYDLRKWAQDTPDEVVNGGTSPAAPVQS